MLSLGFVSAILPHKSFEQVIDYAAAHRFACVEMMCWPRGKAERRYAGVTHVNVNDLDDSEIHNIKTLLIPLQFGMKCFLLFQIHILG
jgi:sugar phosphate isomerase/epimerase